MSYFHEPVYGADYQLGYGFDGKFGYILPFKCEPLELTTLKLDKLTIPWTYMYNQKYYKQIWNQNYMNVLENRLNIKGEEKEYHNLCILKFNGYKKCEGCDKYPENITNYINYINYGFIANVIVKKQALSNEPYEAGKFLMNVIRNESRLSTEQEDLICYVVINGKEKHEWTLKKFVDFCRDHGDDEKYQCTLSFNSKSIVPRPATRFQERDILVEFLEYLYLCYRKLEIILAKEHDFKKYEFEYNMDNILHERDMISNLRDAMGNYTNVFKDSNLQTHIALKRLFYAYKHYSEYCILRGLNMKIRYNFANIIHELQILWKKLTFLTINLEQNEQRKLEKVDILETVKCEDLQKFLKILHQCIEKIEIRMDKVEYPKLENNATITDSIRWISVEFQKSIEEYQKMSRTSFLNMYPTMKKLYWSYLKYIEFCTRHNLSIDEDIPGEIDDLNSWSEKLDSWNLRKVCNEWCGTDEIVFFIEEDNADIDQLLKKVKEKEKFKVVSAVNLDDDEKFMIKHLEADGNVGLFQPKTSFFFDGNNVYESKCPSNDCPDTQRKWMCIDCCELLKIKNVSCGCQEYELNQLDFICPSKKHPRITEEEHDEGSISDVSSKDEKIKELTMKLMEAERKLGQV